MRRTIYIASLPAFKKMSPYPILEFDPTPSGLIEPSEYIKRIDIAEPCVICFFAEVFAKLRQQKRLKVVKQLASEIGKHPIYEFEFEGKRVAAFHPGVGAPLAAGLMEEVIALGCRKFIACGGAGVLDPQIAAGHLLIPTAAVRDEGMSYHYLPPSREVETDPAAVRAIEQTLQAHRLDYLKVKTWTTDGLFRETRPKIERRRAEGCLTVEMETAAFLAVAQFRGVQFGQILYGADDVGSEKWQTRGWTKLSDLRMNLFWLAAEACLRL